MPGRRDEDVLRFQVAVDDPLLVGRRETSRDLECVLHRVARTDGPSREVLAQSRPLEELHDRVGGRPVPADVVDRDDVGVRERRDGFRLALEPRESNGIRGDAVGEHLHRDVSVELPVARAVDLAHAAGAERREDLVAAEAGARGEGHRGQTTVSRQADDRREVRVETVVCPPTA